MKCYKTYKLNDNNKLINEILSNHIINNEKEILNKIKCNNNNCNYISKKEIELCNSCKYVDGCKPIVTDLPKDNVGIRTIKTFASETFTQLHFYDKVYNTAKEEKINVYEMKPLVEFIKNNKLMKEKQPNIIIKKILRSRYILDIYNEDKYKNIQDVIKRIYINLDYIPKLDDYQFNYFKDILINMLDAEIKKNEDNVDTNENNEVCPTKNVNKNTNIKIDDEKLTKNCCIKCDSILKNDELRYCMKCNNLCQVDNCNNIKQMFGNTTLEYCKQHISSNFKYILNY
jgi:hypothetical protein